MANVEIPDLRATEWVKNNIDANKNGIAHNVSAPSTGSQLTDLSDTVSGPPSLWSLTQQQTEHALQCGALQSIQTNYEFVEQNGVHFLVRILSNLAKKEKANQKQQQLRKKGKDFNPFLPYEPDLFVCNLSPTHLCLLNKFNVVHHHILVVTREFEEQETWLNLNDFSALWSGLREINGLAFYNGGKTAGASQRHKHIQLIPLPLSPEGRAIPMEVLLPLSNAASHQPGSRIAALPFHHAFAPLNLNPQDDPIDAAQTLLNCYQMLLQRFSREQQFGGGQKFGFGQTCSLQSGRDRNFIPYNLLITRRWMLLIPRIQEKAYSISINALGFAGSLFVKDQAQLELLKEKGPMTLLQTVGSGPNSYC